MFLLGQLNGIDIEMNGQIFRRLTTRHTATQSFSPGR